MTDALPDDCIGVIFANLRPLQLEDAARVCHQWMRCARKFDPVINYYKDCVPSAWMIYGGDFMTFWLSSDAYVLYKRGGFVCLVAVRSGGVLQPRVNGSGVAPRLLRTVVSGLSG